MFIEITILIIFLSFLINGYRAGCIETFGRVLGAIIGFIVAKSYAHAIISWALMFVSADIAYTVSFAGLFLLVDYLVGSLFRFADSLLSIFTHLPILKQINSGLGAVFGFIEAIFVLGGMYWLLSQANTAPFLQDSSVMMFIAGIFKTVFGVLL